ncbi:MAG: polysaccharide deacetylase family protein [Defluviitaleaceae bacterium]|nr:polysaccharide deacetylase family protein [Defluviitaleaceae bacterium]
MFNLREFLESTGQPAWSQLQNYTINHTLPAVLITGILFSAGEFAVAEASDRAIPVHAALYAEHVEYAYYVEHVEYAEYAPQGEDEPETAYGYAEAQAHEYYYAEAKPVAAYTPSQPVPHRVMYLTFDDGPTRTVTPLILDILAERDIRATFFVVGRNVRANPEIMQRIVDEGHTVAVHSYSHDYAEIYASLEAFVHDFTVTRSIIAEFTGYYSDLYRFPGGSVTRFNANVRDDAIDFLESIGVVYFDWNASIDDSIDNRRTAKQLLERGLETARGDSVIMLAHDTRMVTAEMMAEMIDIFAKDFVFDVLTTDVTPAQMPRR